MFPAEHYLDSTTQQRPTLGTALRPDLNNPIDIFDWLERTPLAPMPRLPARLAPRRLLGRSRWGTSTTLSVWLVGPKMLRQHALTPFFPASTDAVFQGFLTECDCLKLSTPEISPLKINNLVTVTK